MTPAEIAATAVQVRHFCGKVTRHDPHIGCNGFGYAAGPADQLCTRADPHPAHLSCDGKGATP